MPATAPSREEIYLGLLPSDIERRRYAILKPSLAPIAELIPGARILDFGASYGLSAAALVELGAGEVIGVEPEEGRVLEGRRMLGAAGYDRQVTLRHTPDTRDLGLPSGTMDLVVANAVLEHIPQPRAAYIREMWRMLRTAGVLFVNETPNKYVPRDRHTTRGLWGVPWMPKSWARRYAIWRGRYAADGDWDHSGWRGLGHYELLHAIPGAYRAEWEMTRPRHRWLTWLGLPSSLLDPYPIFKIWRRPDPEPDERDM